MDKPNALPAAAPPCGLIRRLAAIFYDSLLLGAIWMGATFPLLSWPTAKPFQPAIRPTRSTYSWSAGSFSVGSGPGAGRPWGCARGVFRCKPRRVIQSAGAPPPSATSPPSSPGFSWVWDSSGNGWTMSASPGTTGSRAPAWWCCPKPETPCRRCCAPI